MLTGLFLQDPSKNIAKYVDNVGQRKSSDAEFWFFFFWGGFFFQIFIIITIPSHVQ